MTAHRLLLSSFALALTGFSFASEESVGLFKGSDFAGWTLVADGGKTVADVCKIDAEGVITVVGQPIGYLATIEPHENYRLHAEWRWTAKPGNGGVLVHITGGPKDRQWPLSLQVQTKHHSVGDVLPMAGAQFAEPLTSPPGSSVPLKGHTGADSEKPAGEWNTCDILCQGDTLEVTINGVSQNRVTGCAPHSGSVGFQLEGTPFELRNVQLTPLNAP